MCLDPCSPPNPSKAAPGGVPTADHKLLHRGLVHRQPHLSSLGEAFGFGIPLGAPLATAKYCFRQSLEAEARLLSSAPPSEHPALGKIPPFSLLPLPQGYLLKYVRVNEVVWLMDTNRYCFFDLQK